MIFASPSSIQGSGFEEKKLKITNPQMDMLSLNIADVKIQKV